MYRHLLALFLLPAVTAVAQQNWQGEWGAYSGSHAEEGRRLTIQNCNQQKCQFLLEAERPGGNSGTSTPESLTIESDTLAKATLAAGTGYGPCTLTFTLQPGSKPSISVTAEGKSCTTYYSTSEAITMAGTYPFRSPVVYSGSKPGRCFLDTSPARSAICEHADLAKIEETWSDLADQYPLQPAAIKDESAYQHVEEMDAAIVHSCDSVSNPTTCLTGRFNTEIAAMQSKQNSYTAGTTDRGDTAEGGKLAQKIAGRYRHREPNGDVQGHEYTTTDTLTIRPVGAASIHFDTELNFFNGHTCSLSGGALYRKDGSFVFDDVSTNAEPGSPACRLAIIPTATGVTFKDINGSCKGYCGARGGWDGEGFAFKERVSVAKAPEKK